MVSVLGWVRCVADTAAAAGPIVYGVRHRVRNRLRLSKMIMSAQGPAPRGTGVECQKAKRDGGSRKFQALEEVTASNRGGRKTRSGDLGRALRSVYDDTLREAVPDDFVSLLGKLS